MNFIFGSSNSSSKQISKNNPIDTSSIDSVINIINSNSDDNVSEIKYTTQIKFLKNSIYNNYNINIMDFFCNVYGNLRPKSLEINIKNYNEKDSKSIDVWYLHTPLSNKEIDYKLLHQFKNHKEFNSYINIVNNTPYMVLCQEDEHNNILDIDVSQITNVNLKPNRYLNVSLGQLIFQIQRNTKEDILLELTFKLKYSFKQY